MTRYHVWFGLRGCLHESYGDMTANEAWWSFVDAIEDHLELMHDLSEEEMNEEMVDVHNNKYDIWYCPYCMWVIGREECDQPTAEACDVCSA